MFPCQNTPDFYCKKSVMEHSSTNSWSRSQNHCAVRYQNNPQMTEPVPYPVAAPKQKLYCNFMAKRHHAQITIAPTKNGSFNAIVKRKRKRTKFTTEQIESLENIFKTNQYITRDKRKDIVDQLQLNDKAVKIWFQNRRLKHKNVPENTENITETLITAEEKSAQDKARLEYVESQINKKTDEYGFVTLDDAMMGNLISVINDSLIDDNPECLTDDSVESGSSPIYEPVSPVSDSNDEDNLISWKPPKPNESLQKLFDLQYILSL